MLSKVIVCLGFALVGCSGGAVVFAPTPAPPDVSPLRYVHPGGAFSVDVPRTWAVYTQNTTALASAAFTLPDESEPGLSFAVINLGQTLNSAALGEAINQYQSEVRPDIGRYSEQNRQAMGDGSWRFTGLRRTVSGVTQQVNTFIERSDTYLGVIEVIIPQDGAQLAELQQALNTFQIDATAPLEATELATLTTATTSDVGVLNVSAWTTSDGVFFITGEVANYGNATAVGLPVRAILVTSDGLAVAEAVDTVMGHGIPPGGFAPFSLRFGQGQPARTTTYELTLGSADWQPDPQIALVGPEQLSWMDESVISDDGRLLITGSVTNEGAEAVRDLLATVTVFDSVRNVIAAAFVDIIPERLAPGESAPFQFVVPEIGGEPAHYIVNVQGRG